jgi:epoxyqueuosine reductase
MKSKEARISGDLIREEAHRLGFDLVGIASSRNLEEQRPNLHSWIEKKMNAEMSFISRNISSRLDPGYLVPGAKSVIVTGLNYFPRSVQGGSRIPVISKYAYGEDYHFVIKNKLEKLFDYIHTINPKVKGKICVDSSPLLEKAWAREAGLGWVGKNSLIITKEYGSFIFLGEIILDIELDYNEPFQKDNCGSCDLCIKACPTSAINDNRTINAGKCISWLTVENKKEIPAEFRKNLRNRVFGCDICQDVCPWNKNLSPHRNERFNIHPEVMGMSAEDWKNLSQTQFDRLFSKTPLERIGYKKISETISILTEPQ